MAPRLSPEDYRLLDDLDRSGGIARISDGRPRHGADRLVDVGLATSRSLNISDVEYEMTPLGRKAPVFAFEPSLREMRNRGEAIK